VITAKIIAHSKCALTGKEIVTWELVYPRLIHSELMTHRLFSRNAASSRAIPVNKLLDMIRENPARPTRFGANQPGMQDKGVDHDALVWIEVTKSDGVVEMIPHTHDQAWDCASYDAIEWAAAFSKAGYHKQVCNRLTEPYQWMKTVLTATETDNWFWLRDHSEADPTIHELAIKMWDSLDNSTPVVLKAGDWHMPYYGEGFWKDSGYMGQNMEAIFNKRDSTSTLKNALIISSSCCAQVSYRVLDDTLEKAQYVYDRLIDSEPVHASPFEHQATPMKPEYVGNMNPSVNLSVFPRSWEQGVTHVGRNGAFWSGNFNGWIQHRQLIPNNACWEYTKRDKEL
jgi:hypothetical protein